MIPKNKTTESIMHLATKVPFDFEKQPWDFIGNLRPVNLEQNYSISRNILFLKLELNIGLAYNFCS